jgi:hypothetical protein
MSLNMGTKGLFLLLWEHLILSCLTVVRNIGEHPTKVCPVQHFFHLQKEKRVMGVYKEIPYLCQGAKYHRQRDWTYRLYKEARTL